jgi:hypothetical protein
VSAIVIASAVALSVWLIPTSQSTKVNVISPTTRPAPVPTSVPTPITSVAPSMTAAPGASTILPTLVYAGPGVAVVGVSPVGAGNQGTQPPVAEAGTLSTFPADLCAPRRNVLATFNEVDNQPGCPDHLLSLVEFRPRPGLVVFSSPSAAEILDRTGAAIRSCGDASVTIEAVRYRSGETVDGDALGA